MDFYLLDANNSKIRRSAASSVPEKHNPPSNFLWRIFFSPARLPSCIFYKPLGFLLSRPHRLLIALLFFCPLFYLSPSVCLYVLTSVSVRVCVCLCRASSFLHSTNKRNVRVTAHVWIHPLPVCVRGKEKKKSFWAAVSLFFVWLRVFASGRPARTRLLTERLSHSHVTPQQKQDRQEAKLESVSLFG